MFRYPLIPLLAALSVLVILMTEPLTLAFGAENAAIPPQSTIPSPISVTVTRPKPNALVGDVLDISVSVSSVYEIQAVQATVADRQAFLTFSTHSGVWEGQISLVGLARGAKSMTVVVEDAFGNRGETESVFVYDRSPDIEVLSPEPGTVARPGIGLRANCRDDDSGVGCTNFSVAVEGIVIASGKSAIDEAVDIPAQFNGRGVELQFSAQDSAGQRTTVLRSIYVESSPHLLEVERVPGQIWDISENRILYLDSRAGRNTLKIRMRSTGKDEVVYDSGGGAPKYGYLSPFGAIFVEQSSTALSNSLYEWRDGQLSSFGALNSSTSLVARGDYAIWNQGGNLFRRDLRLGTTVQIASDSGNIDNDVARNGDVVFWANYDIFRYRDGLISPISDDRSYWDTYPRTDGINIIYRKHGPCCGNQQYKIVLSDGSQELVLGSQRAQEPRPGGDYQVNNGWAAFTEPGSSNQFQVWLRNPLGSKKQVSFFSTSSFIEKLAENGELIFHSSRRHYLFRYDKPTLDISTNLGWATWQEGNWYKVIGGTIFLVYTSTPTPTVTPTVTPSVSPTPTATPTATPHPTDNIAPLGALAINPGPGTGRSALYTTHPVIILSLEASDPEGPVTAFRISADGIHYSDWQNYVRASSFALPERDGPHTLFVQFMDTSGNVSIPYTDTIILDRRYGNDPSITIDSGNLWTNETQVSLILPATGATAEMQVSNDGGFGNAQWEPYSLYKEWQITSHGNHILPRTVYVRFRNTAGTVTGTFQDDIILDITAPTSRITEISHDPSAAGVVPVNIHWSGNDDVSGVKWYDLQVKEDSGLWTEWLSHVNYLESTYLATKGHAYSFRIRAQDNAGNWASFGENEQSIVLFDNTRIHLPIVRN